MLSRLVLFTSRLFFLVFFIKSKVYIYCGFFSALFFLFSPTDLYLSVCVLIMKPCYVWLFISLYTSLCLLAGHHHACVPSYEKLFFVYDCYMRKYCVFVWVYNSLYKLLMLQPRWYFTASYERRESISTISIYIHNI